MERWVERQFARWFSRARAEEARRLKAGKDEPTEFAGFGVERAERRREAWEAWKTYVLWVNDGSPDDEDDEDDAMMDDARGNR